MRTRSEAKKAAAAGTETRVAADEESTGGEPARKRGDAGKQLADALDPPPNPLAWASANAAKAVPLDADFDRITEMVFVENPLEVYKQLEAALRVGEKRSDHGTMMRALDEAEGNARMAHRLYITAKVEQDRWERENGVVFGAMRAEATRALQREKDQGGRSKQITDADVESMCATLYPDEYQHQEHKRKRVKAMVDSMANLVDAWNSRCRGLQVAVTKMR